MRPFFESAAMNDDGITLKSELHGNIDAQFDHLNKIGHALHELSPAFSDFVRDIKVQQLVKHLGYISPLLVQTMFLRKAAILGTAVPPHRDNTFLLSGTAVLGLWWALEEANTSNGCLWVLPGSHLRSEVEKRPRFVRTVDSQSNINRTVMLGQTLDKDVNQLDAYVPLEAHVGDLVLIHGDLLHQSLPNVSEKSRCALSLHLVDSAAPNYEWSAENWLQRGEVDGGSPPFRSF